MDRQCAVTAAVIGIALLMSSAWLSYAQETQPDQPARQGQDAQQGTKQGTQKGTQGQPARQDQGSQQGTKQGTQKGTQKGTQGQPARQDEGSQKAQKTHEVEQGHEKETNLENLTDEQFVMKASKMDLAEVNLGRYAAGKAIKPDVKNYAQKMVVDHTKSSAMLMGIANKKGFRLAQKMDEKHQAMMEKLMALSGPEFDREYMKHMAIDHKKAVALFEHQAKNGKDADLKAFAAKVLPIVRQHLEMAQPYAQERSSDSDTPESGTVKTPGKKRQ